ncbi:HAD family phosphatase [Sphingomonas sp. 1P06PA]|uniref:HAD family hydrolase n=1 Tax=Sphingomonas sp. 1P06PA TaxID=554121 RepID=UPI0039A7211D
MPAAPSAVVFDVGHVLFDWDPRYLYQTLIDDADALDSFLRDVVTREWHFQHDAGRPFAETSAELIAAYPQHEALIAQFGPRFLDTLPGPIAGMPEIVAALDARDVPLFAITNFSAEFWVPFRAREAAIFDRFRDIVVSGVERLIKPDPAIYALALDRFGLNQGEALFVDDRADNVAAGEAAGFVGHHFSDATTLRADLVRYGLLAG